MTVSKPPRAWQRMLSGRRLDLLDPSPLDIELSDIAHGLARVARWNGQTHGDHAFSVAQHSLLVCDIVARLEPDCDPALLKAALLHDAPEYVIGDMISPLKSVVGGSYKSVEKHLLTAIHLHFGLSPTLPAAWTRFIKRADQIAAWHEATGLAGFSDDEAARTFQRPRDFDPADFDLTPLPATEVQAAFRKRVLDLDRQTRPVSRRTAENRHKTR